jgi:hypothetical protein
VVCGEPPPVSRVERASTSVDHHKMMK